MCGIVAIFSYRDGAAPIDPFELARARDAMSSRGPDGAGLWVAPDRRVGLGHRRLSIIDLTEAGLQPMANADGSLRIVFNGEIYNYRALRAELERKGYRFRSNSDTEALLHLYADKGSAMMRELRGMYAFAIWDSRRRQLFAARDPFGIKPLYYVDDGRTLRLASQVKALVRGGRVDTDLEPAGHVGFMLWGVVPEPYTFYRRMRAVPAGSTLTVTRGGTPTVRSFCDISEELELAAEADGSAAEPAQGAERLHAALRDSVEHHLVADVPVGVFLSSGLDSSTVTALAAESNATELRTFTLGFEELRGTSQDETVFAEQIARRYGTFHQTGWMSGEEFYAGADEMLDAMDQPTIDGVNTYFVSKLAARTGLKVALSGLGGDELFAGYEGFRQIPLLVKLTRPVPAALGTWMRKISAPMLQRLVSPKYASIFEYGGSYSGAYLLRRCVFLPWELPEVIDPEIVREGWRELQPLACLKEIDRKVANPRVKLTAMELSWFMRNQLLRDADWAGLAHSLEIRTPLVDLELLRKIAPLLNGATPPGKLDMARTPARPLPEQVLQRPKSGFTIPVDRWLRRRNGLVKSNERGFRGWARLVYEHYTRERTEVSALRVASL
ncbi:MAG: asparagine synthase (glutamine-hydrolyzing) [Candidatus Binataceae bacterium]